MKSKLLIMGVLCAFAFAANAQTEKGQNFINGSFGYKATKYGSDATNSMSNTNYGDTSKTFNVMPRFGHFFAKNFAVGLSVGYNNDKSITGSTNLSTTTIIYSLQTEKQHSFSVGPFVRYYVDVADKFKFFGQLNTSIGFGKSDRSSNYTLYNFGGSGTPTMHVNDKSSYKFTAYNASINPGFAFFPSKRWAIEFSFPLLDYSKQEPKDIEPASISIYTVENFSLATDSFNPSIGFNFHF